MRSRIARCHPLPLINKRKWRWFREVYRKEQEPARGRVAQPVLLVGRALRARREHLRMAVKRGIVRPPAARSGLRALPLSA